MLSLPLLLEFAAYMVGSFWKIYIVNTFLRIDFITLTLFIGVGAVILIRDYVNALNEKDKINATLEATVEERTHNLEAQKEIAQRQTLLAVEASKAKSEFLARMSHEVRTPLNAILGLSKLLLSKKPPDELYEDITDIQTEGSNLLQIVNSILDFSKIESGKIDIVNKNYLFKGLIDEIGEAVKAIISSTNLQFIVELDARIPESLKGDALRIKQILLNLLGNSLKYTQHGFVKLSASLASPAGEAPVLCFKVIDSGIGIRVEDQARLFQDFTRVDIEKNRSIPGTGLGLAICASYCKAMGGTISVESVYGHGSVFIIELPQEAADSPFPGPAEGNKLEPSFSAPKARILIVDDMRTNLKVAEAMVGLFKAQIDTVRSGNEALEKIRTSPPYDLILLDHMMPEKDGIETAREIRALGLKDLPIIALTANAVSGMREMFIESGFNGYLSKPIVFKELESVLSAWLPKEKLQV
jgi:signal transduction histidine kinase/ActR/RegA family two-component response regulator